MFTIVTISNDTRSAGAMRPFEAMISGRIICTGDFDGGLKEVFEKRPAVVFIQDDIDGVSGETVGKHIKSLLQSGCPRLVLLSKNSRLRSASSAFDDVINLSLPEYEVRESFRFQFDTLGPDVWREQHIPVVVGGDFPPVAKMVTHDELEQLLSVVPAPQEPEPEEEAEPDPVVPALRGVQPPVAEVAVLQVASASAMPEPSPRAPFEFPSSQGGTWGEPDPVPPPQAPAPPESDWLKGIRTRRVDPVPLAVRQASDAAWGRRLMVGVAALMVVAMIIGASYAIMSSSLFRRTFKEKQAAPVMAAVAGKPQIPSFVPRNGNDPGYRTANPGWDRYADAGREYLIFREKDALKALQVVALKDGAIPEDFVVSALREIGGGAASTVTSRREKDGYVLESGKAGASEVLVYRKKETGKVRALVITFS